MLSCRYGLEVAPASVTSVLTSLTTITAVVPLLPLLRGMRARCGIETPSLTNGLYQINLSAVMAHGISLLSARIIPQ